MAFKGILIIGRNFKVLLFHLSVIWSDKRDPIDSEILLAEDLQRRQASLILFRYIQL